MMEEVTCMGHATRMKYVRNENNILNRKREGKRSFGKPTSRWENNIILILNKQGGNVRIGFT